MDQEENRREWGFYEVLSDGTDHKVKRITVYPGKRISLQRHGKRSEHWFILQGDALVTLDSGKHPMKQGESIDIGVSRIHRMENLGGCNVVFIEVQTGSYFGEDDIERLEDDYGRV